MNIYVGNLSYDVTEDDLRGFFESYGKVTTATIIKDKFSGKSKGFGFVEMPSNSEAESAIESLNGNEFKGRTLIVNEARSRTENRKGYGGGGKKGGGGYRKDNKGGGKRGGGGRRF